MHIDLTSIAPGARVGHCALRERRRRWRRKRLSKKEENEIQVLFFERVEMESMVH